MQHKTSTSKMLLHLTWYNLGGKNCASNNEKKFRFFEQHTIKQLGHLPCHQDLPTRTMTCKTYHNFLDRKTNWRHCQILSLRTTTHRMNLATTSQIQWRLLEYSVPPLLLPPHPTRPHHPQHCPVILSILLVIHPRTLKVSNIKVHVVKNLNHQYHWNLVPPMKSVQCQMVWQSWNKYNQNK